MTAASGSQSRAVAGHRSSTLRTKSGSDSDGHLDTIVFTPELTPSDTPSGTSAGIETARTGHRRSPNAARMDSKKNDGLAAEDRDQAPPGAAASSKPARNKDMLPPRNRDRGKPKHRHVGRKKSGRRKLEGKSNSDSVSSWESSSSESEDDESESDDVETSQSESDSEDDRRRRRQKGRKPSHGAHGTKARRRPKTRKEQDGVASGSNIESPRADSSSESDESEGYVSRRSKGSPPKKGRPKKPRKEDGATDAETGANPELEDIKAQVRDLNERLAKVTTGSTAPTSKKEVDESNSESKPKGKGKKKGKSARRKHRSRSKTSKRASKLEYKRVDQLWDDTIHNFKLTDTAEGEDADEYDQYIFTVRRQFDWKGKYTDTVVDIKSQILKEALQGVMDGVKGVSLVEETPMVDPNMLFLYLEELRAAMKELKKKSKTEKKKKIRKRNVQKIAHMKVLLKYLDEDYAEIKKTLYPLLESNLITFDLLWALYKPNTIAYTTTYGNADEPRAFRVEYAAKDSNFQKGTWYSIEGRYLEYDGKAFGMGTMEVDVDSFKGARKITSLATYPLKYHKDQSALRKQLIERGKKFVALKGMNYRFHKGMAFYKKKRTVGKVNINGRIMVDSAIHRRINPNYPVSTVKPKDDEDGSGGEDSEDNSSCCCGQSSDEEAEGENDAVESLDGEEEEEKQRFKIVLTDDGTPKAVAVDLDSNGEEVQDSKIEKLDDEEPDREFTEDELILASPVVLGFAFSEKLWLEFTVSGVKDIEWNEGAFDSLVLPENQKSIVKALVESHTFHAAQNIEDVIQGKGKGLVAVLHGPPGTGKTLTAEGIAELLKRPLYMVSAGELGTDPRMLEAELNKLLDLSHSWGAVLLLDEADVFLEKRTIQDIHRNALVSIFLRLLEYFQGILFLTTNRVETFDDAFQSRIHVALRYGELTTKAKMTVWKMFIDRVKAKEGLDVAAFKEVDFENLARNNLNGRQIKNCVRTAQALAVNNKEKLSMEHIKRVLNVVESFDRELKGGPGYIEAMRSYT